MAWGAGAHHAEMMALALAFAGREVGGYKPTGGYFLPDRYAAIAIGKNGKIGNAETRPETSGRR